MLNTKQSGVFQTPQPTHKAKVQSVDLGLGNKDKFAKKLNWQLYTTYNKNVKSHSSFQSRKNS